MLTPNSKRRGLIKAALMFPFGALGAARHAREETSPPAKPSVDGACTLYPQAVEGPFYFDPKLVRGDITDGRKGFEIALHLKVIEAGPCTPIRNARVDIWHADANGMYSGYGGQGDGGDVSTKGQSFLRGTQMTNEDGIVQFRSVYPGWYPGRTPHIHLKIFLDETTLVTGQIYFPDEVSRRVYSTHDRYKARGTADTTNEADFIFTSGMAEGGGIVFTMSEDKAPMRASLVIAVDRSGDAAERTKGWGQRMRERMGL